MLVDFVSYAMLSRVKAKNKLLGEVCVLVVVRLQLLKPVHVYRLQELKTKINFP